MQSTVLKTIKQYNMLNKGSQVTVALSGGADSVVLLHILCDIAEEYDLKITAAHLNHQLRGEESLRDEMFVKKLCKEKGIELFTQRADILAECQKTGESVELAARRVRYDFLYRVSKGFIATAHTASDNVETVLFNLARGTSVSGLCGIPPVRDRIIRPLICVTRKDIERYAKENLIEFVDDSSNFSDDYSRNRLRHHAVPVLRAINPGLEAAVSRMTECVSEDNRCLNTLAEQLYNKVLTPQGLAVQELKDKPAALVKRVLKIEFSKHSDVMLEKEHIDSLYFLTQSVSGKCSLPGNITAVLSGKVLHFFKNGQAAPEFQTEITVVSVKDFENIKKVNTLLLKNALDYDKITGELVLRARLAGDSIRLSGRGTKTLKKLYNEASVSPEERSTLPVLADAAGPVWIYSFGVADRVRITGETRKVLLINSKKIIRDI